MLMFKLVNGSKNKIVKISHASFQLLKKQIDKSFNNLPSDYCLSYLDQDNDQICLNSDQDMNVLLSMNSKINKVFIKQSFSQVIQIDNTFKVEPAFQANSSIKEPHIIINQKKEKNKDDNVYIDEAIKIQISENSADNIEISKEQDKLQEKHQKQQITIQKSEETDINYKNTDVFQNIFLKKNEIVNVNQINIQQKVQIQQFQPVIQLKNQQKTQQLKHKIDSQLNLGLINKSIQQNLIDQLLNDRKEKTIDQLLKEIDIKQSNQYINQIQIQIKQDLDNKDKVNHQLQQQNFKDVNNQANKYINQIEQINKDDQLKVQKHQKIDNFEKLQQKLQQIVKVSEDKIKIQQKKQQIVIQIPKISKQQIKKQQIIKQLQEKIQKIPKKGTIFKNPLVIQQKKKQSIELNYHNVICSVCQDDYGIIGIRYQCILCQNYNICQKCQQKCDHAHSLVKIKVPSKEIKKEDIIKKYRRQIYGPIENQIKIPQGHYIPSISKDQVLNYIKIAQENFNQCMQRNKRIMNDMYLKLQMNHKNPYEIIKKEQKVQIKPNTQTLQEKVAYLKDLLGVQQRQATYYCNLYKNISKEKILELYIEKKINKG